MVKTGGRVFATPGERFSLPQQVEIAALHQLHASAHKANGAVAQVMRLPAGTGGGACVAEHTRRNDAIGLASKAPIKRTQRKTKAMMPLVCQPIRRTDAWAADNETPEAQCCVGACGEISIERDDDCGGQITPRLSDGDPGPTGLPATPLPQIPPPAPPPPPAPAAAPPH